MIDNLEIPNKIDSIINEGFNNNININCSRGFYYLSIKFKNNKIK